MESGKGDNAPQHGHGPETGGVQKLWKVIEREPKSPIGRGGWEKSSLSWLGEEVEGREAEEKVEHESKGGVSFKDQRVANRVKHEVQVSRLEEVPRMWQWGPVSLSRRQVPGPFIMGLLEFLISSLICVPHK